MTVLLRLLLAGLWKPVAAVFVALTLWLAGRQSAKTAAKIDRLQADAKAHERMNDAEAGIGATDAERIDWLRRYADRNRD